MRLALFDLDNTLLNGDSDYEWGQFLIQKGVLDKAVHEAKNQAFYDAYNAGNMNINEFLSYQLGNLAEHSRLKLKKWREEFLPKRILPLITSQARSLLKSHDDDVKIIITATNSFVTEPIAKELGINNLIATEPQIKNGEFNGLVEGIPAFREGKVDRLKKWLRENEMIFSDFSETWFYSDSMNDLPLLSFVSHPVAVDPDPALEGYAIKHGWQIISLRTING